MKINFIIVFLKALKLQEYAIQNREFYLKKLVGPWRCPGKTDKISRQIFFKQLLSETLLCKIYIFQDIPGPDFFRTSCSYLKLITKAIVLSCFMYN